MGHIKTVKEAHVQERRRESESTKSLWNDISFAAWQILGRD